VSSAPLVPNTLVPEALLPAMGLLVAAYARLDEVLAFTIWHVAGLDDATGNCFTSEIKGSARFTVLRRLIARRVPGEQLAADLLSVIVAAERAVAIRNRVVHDEVWAAELAEQRIEIVQHRHATAYDDPKAFTIGEAAMREASHQMLLAARRLQAFVNGHAAWRTAELLP
jgi:hypothetical protein